LLAFLSAWDVYLAFACELHMCSRYMFEPQPCCCLNGSMLELCRTTAIQNYHPCQFVDNRLKGDTMMEVIHHFIIEFSCGSPSSDSAIFPSCRVGFRGAARWGVSLILWSSSASWASYVDVEAVDILFLYRLLFFTCNVVVEWLFSSYPCIGQKRRRNGLYFVV